MGEAACAVCDELVAREDAYCTHQPKGDKPASYRCTKCNSLQTRVYRARGTVAWPSKEAKKEFFQQHSALTGHELKKELEITLWQVEKEITRECDEEVAEWLGEIDLQAKIPGQTDTAPIHPGESWEKRTPYQRGHPVCRHHNQTPSCQER